MAAAKNEDDLSGLELVKLLLRRIARGFYQAKHCILLDIIIEYSAIRDDYIARMMGLQSQEVRKLCGRLRDDRLITLHTRPEEKAGHTRLVNRSYYYIDYRDAVDAIKFRMHSLVHKVQEQSKNDFGSKFYVCPYCHRRYSSLDILPLFRDNMFLCSTDSTPLVDDEESIESKAAQERLTRLQNQTNRLLSTLKAIDNSIVPDNDFTKAFTNQRPPDLVDESDLLYTNAYPHGVPGQSINNNITQTTTAALGVTVDYGGDQRDSAEETIKRAAQAQINQLPDWHLHSTVPGEAISESKEITEAFEKEDVKEVKLDAAATDEVAEYYRSLRAQEQAESETDEEEAEEEEEEDEEMEDLPIAAPAVKNGSLDTRTVSFETSKQEDDSEEEFEDV